MSESELTITHDRAARRFEAVAEGGTGYLSYVEAGPGILDFRHTYVPHALRGRGIASRLVERGLGYAKEQGFRVIPTCPFVAAVLARRPDRAELEAP